MSEIRPRLSVQFELFNNNHFKTLLLKYFNPQLYSAHLNNFSHLENILMAGSYPADCDMVLAMFSVWWVSDVLVSWTVYIMLTTAQHPHNINMGSHEDLTQKISLCLAGCHPTMSNRRLP